MTMRVVLAQERVQNREQPRAAALGLGLVCESTDCVGLEDLPVRLSQGEADMVMVNLNPQNFSRGLLTIQQTALQSSVPVLALGPTNDPQLILQAMRAGARVYLDERNIRDELSAALLHLGQAGTMLEGHRGEVMLICSAVPGVGVTTVASSIAFALAEKHPNQVMLGELGAGVPALALALDLHPRYTINDLRQNWERFDCTMMRQTLHEHPGGVYILTHPPEMLESEPMEPMAIRNMLLLLKSMFEYVVIDLGHHLDAAMVSALALADKVVVVTRLDVPALRLTRRLVCQLKGKGVAPGKLKMIANRCGTGKQIGVKQAEEAVGLPVAESIPDDAVTMNNALNTGMPLHQSARRAGITKTFAKLAGDLNGRLTRK